ncbi:hypothetical protein DYBT9275_04264 [Dyadobacter sp. CECT 9275]|uniref:Activator of Hsp90 ATPase homologue 1/2-like C-terminal domain-containing protein n=1 Tax=Dyadobacter helix TaxID=2822344 RepID=A0A916JGD4_9BACT|nr:SRPBCC family protein [Dyadobacter sp. CECT 9275]CAG5008421.1 hypothetical protein DYBT9275_04264 [Dyadobacter sp. CECT 9275]
MEAHENTSVTVQATINAPLEKVWQYWTLPEHITKWTQASDDWHAPHATNDLQAGGKFLTRMEARDGSFGFDFEGIYDVVETHSRIEYSMADGRRVQIFFVPDGDQTSVTETFDPEDIHPADFQKAGWQAILDNFKKYTEGN